MTIHNYICHKLFKPGHIWHSKILEIKPYGLGSRIRDVEAFWYKTEFEIIYFLPLCLIVLIVYDCMVYPDPKKIKNWVSKIKYKNLESGWTIQLDTSKKQARKGFWAPSVMKEIGYFKILEIYWEIVCKFFGNFLGIF